ncbi:YqaJ viral recombinase domain [Elysia marginata]|uniref:YqaJ viral recombinase domain n=1 Tax=Elysia marginata TaxID=1093978 RepID=A0AAV4JKK2_9GAST|nr:YqaJ viral recombinase domain [Elysia marginata]
MAQVEEDGLQQFVQMTKVELTHYPGARGMDTTGGKQALIARALVAWESKAPIKVSTEDFKKQLKLDYKNTLSQHNIPDPWSLPSDVWSDNVYRWPLVDMGKIFMSLLSTKEYNTDYLGKYKTEKAYSYFTSNFVGTVWAQVLNDTERCFPTREVTPSQNVRADPHKLWVLLNNTGEVLTSVSSCTAGLCHTCNHMIAVLYKVEYAIGNNVHSKSCTETSCQWNKGTRKEIKPKKFKTWIYGRTKRPENLCQLRQDKITRI